MFLIYIAVIFGLQYPDLGNGFAESLMPFATLGEIRALGFLVTSTGFFLAAYIPRRFLFPSNYDWGCINLLIVAFFAWWFVYTALSKYFIYLEVPFEATPAIVRGERFFDFIVQFWFPADPNYYLHGILNQSIFEP